MAENSSSFLETVRSLDELLSGFLTCPPCKGTPVTPSSVLLFPEVARHVSQCLPPDSMAKGTGVEGSGGSPLIAFACAALPV